MAVGPSSMSSASPSSSCQPGGVARRSDPHARDDAQHRQVPHAVVAGPVWTGDAGAVQHDRHRKLVQRNVHDDLVERAVEERRVDRDDGVQSAHRQAGRRRHRVLLGDADVEEAVGEPLTECAQPGGAGHGRGDCHDVAAFGPVVDQRVGERRRPAWSGDLGRHPGERVDDAGGMHLLGLVVLGRRVAHALAGDDVHDHRRVEAPRVAQRGLHRVLVVAVDRSDVLQPEVGEHHLRGQRVLDAGLDAVHALVAELADDRHAPHRGAALLQQFLVARLQPQRGQMVGETADGRRVAAPVVVDHDDHRPTRRGDIVQRLPAHAAGERAVADDGDHMAVAVPGQLEGLCQPVGVGQRRRGVAGLHPVVLALAAAGVARQPALLAQRVEVVAAPRQHLVHIRLMTSVEDDRVVR